MRRESFAKKRLYPVLFMLAVTLVFITVTTVIHTFTRERVDLNERLTLKRAVLGASGVPLPSDPAGIERTYDERVREVKDGGGATRYYEILGSGSSDIAGYVVIQSGPGLWGEITAAIGFNRDLEVFLGLEIIAQNETPGLGGRIDEVWFKEQFRGKRPPLGTVPEGAPARDTQFQAITGASYSTEAVQIIVNTAMVYAKMEIPSSE